jgi:rhodanese-related sulfurtransferase
MSNSAISIPPASPEATIAHIEAKLALEADCWDVHEALRQGAANLVVLDCRSPSLYADGHVPGAISLPHGKITATRVEAFPAETIFITYCNGPHCNGADRGALRLARLGRPVKIMAGGVEGWRDEGFLLARGEARSSVAEVEGTQAA